MTQEDKELLLKDLCARLPYGVNIQVYYEEMTGSGYFDETVWVVDNDEPFHVNDRWIENIKPYLRPMSSMTSDEFEEFTNIVEHISIGKSQINIANPEAFDFLNAHHFDYRGLIDKGLAIEITEENNPYKE